MLCHGLWLCERSDQPGRLEDTEDLEVVLADREEVRRILKEERVAIMCAYMLMHFLKEEEPFGFCSCKQKIGML